MSNKIFVILLLISLFSISIIAEPQKILILGDSHYAGTYGQELDKLLKQSGNIVESYGCVSATAQHYIDGGKHCIKPIQGSTHNSIQEDYTLSPITQYLSTFSPNIVIISLGGNIESSTSSKDIRVKQISQLVKAITDKNIKCIWVGPPGKNDIEESKDRDTFYTQLQEALGQTCQLIDSRPLAQLNKDEIHFSDFQRPKDWAQKVFTQFKPMTEFTGPPLSALETEDEKKAYLDFDTEPQIVEDASIPQEPTTSGFDASTQQSAASAKTISTQFFCDNPFRCQNIDEVWHKKIGIYINPIFAELIWDPRTNNWKTFQEIYTLPTPQLFPTPPIIPSTTLLPIDESKLSKKIIQEKAAGKYDDAFLAKVNQIATTLNTKPEYLIAIMRFETGGTFDPCKKSKWSSATGLIQFLKSTAQRLGTTTDQLCKMTQVQQLDYVENYFNWFKHKIRPNDLGDIAMAVFWPRAIRKEDTYVLFEQGTGAYNSNKALDRDNNGEITRAEYLNLVIKRM